MAKLKAVRNRGRKKGALRVAMTALAAKVSAGSGSKELTIEVVPQRGRKSPETIVVSMPTGTQVVPVHLTADKTEENAREQLRLAISDAGRSKEVGIRSATFEADDGSEGIVWMMVGKVAKVTSTPKPKAKAKK